MSKRSCPRKNSPEWKTLVAKVGNREAFRDYMETNGEIRTPEEVLEKLAKRKLKLQDISSLGKLEGEKMSTEKGSIGVNKQQLLMLLGPTMYNKPLAQVAVKELLQNSFDATKARQNLTENKSPGQIRLSINMKDRTISIRDNGIGMSPDIVKNAFLSIGGTNKEGLSTEERSGGFGLAKVQFLLGSEYVKVITVKDGVKTSINATSIQLYNDDFEIHTEKVSEPNGTYVEVKVPENYTTLEGTKRDIDFPGRWSGYKDYDILEKPLIGNIDVKVKVINSSNEETTTVLPVGINITNEILPPLLTNVKFNWGNAEVYLSENKVERPTHQILSSGIYQFDYNFKDSEYDSIPYNIVVNIKPSVGSTSEQYPFNNQREGFKNTISEDIKSLNSYLLKYASGEAEIEAKANFKNIIALPVVDPNKVLTPEEKEKLTKIVDERLKEIESGSDKIEKTQRVVRYIEVDKGVITNTETGEIESTEKEWSSTFKADKEIEETAPLDMSDFNDNSPQFHNNTNVDYLKTPGAVEFFTDFGNVVHQIVKEFGGDYLPNKRSSGYSKLKGKNIESNRESYFAGISIDKSYHGIHTYSPFKAVFINPLSYDTNSVEDLTYKYLITIIHEIVHTTQANHDYNKFGRELQDVIGIFFASPRAELYTGLLRSTFKKHLQTYTNLTKEYGKSTTKNLSKSFEGQEDTTNPSQINDGSGTNSEKRGEGRSRDDRRSESSTDLSEKDKLGDVIASQLTKTQQSGRNLDFYMGDQALMDQEEGSEEEVIITPSETEQILKVENAIKNELPVEIANAVTVVQDVPIDILGRDDLFLSIKNILNDNGINDEILINWAGINKDSINIKSLKSEQQLLSIIEQKYAKNKNPENHPALKSSKLVLESFNKWVAALKNYPAPFREIMLTHAIKHLNPQRRAKYVLQLSDVALTQAYGIVVNKPHELNRIGKLYDSEVLKTVSDAVGHEPSASGNGYWVHIPRTKVEVTFNAEDNEDVAQRMAETGQRRGFVTETKTDNSAQFKVNVELLRKLSPSTWCTASGMASHYVENYDNYLLIVNGITVAGIEAMPAEEDNSDYLIQELENKIQNLENTESYTIDRNIIKGQPSTFTSVIRPFKGDIIYLKTNDREEINAQEEDAIKKINEDLQKEIRNLKNTIKTLSEEIKLRKVKEVTSRGNNGVSSIDHYDDILAFFEKHNLDTDNRSLQNAKNAKDKGKVDAEIIKDYEVDNYWGEDDRGDVDDIAEEYRREQEEQDQLNEDLYEQHDVRELTTVENAKILFAQYPEMLKWFYELKPELKNNEVIARLGVTYDAHNIMQIRSDMLFYNELVEQAVRQTPRVFNYIGEEAQNLPGLRTIYNDVDQLPFSKTNTNQIQGYYDAKNDKVVVVASNTPVDEAPKVAIHEVAHRGMLRMAEDLGGMTELSRVLFGAEKQLMEKLPELLKRTGHKSLENLMLDYGFDKNSKEGKLKLLMELAARWAETLIDKPKPSWWKQLIQDIKKWIKKFTNHILSEQEVNELVGGFVKYGTKTKQTKVNEPTSIAKYKKAVGLTRKEIHGHNRGFIKVAEKKYNTKHGSKYSVAFTQIGESTYYTYTISGNEGSGVQTSIAFNREYTFSSPESILNNSTISYSSFSQVPVTFSLKSNENALGEKMLINLNERISQNLGVAYFENITPEKAIQLTSKSKIPWNGETAFFIGNTVYFVGSNTNASIQLHEFSHPLVRAIKITNPKLFDKLYSDLKNTVEGKEIIAFIEKEYPEYVKDDSDFMEEAVVRSLTKAAVLVRQNYVGSSSFLKFIKDFLYQIKKYLRQVFGKIKVDKLDVNTSISELADMLHNEFFDIKEDIISEADIVSYNRVSENYRNELKVLTDKSPSDLQNIANEIFLLSNNHLDKIINNKNYTALEEVLKDALSRNEIEEMKKSIFDYQTVLLSKGIKVFDELKFKENQVGIIIQNLERMDSITKKIQNYMKILSSEVNTPDKVSQMYHYSIIMSENQAFVKQVDIVLDENDLRDSSLAVLTAKINSNIEASKVYNKKVYEAGVTDTLYEYVENLAETLELRHNEQIAYLTKSNAPKSLFDRENKRYALLKMDKEKFRAILNGQLEDAGALSQFFESYMGNPDPVIASFGLYVKKHVYDALYKMRDKTNDFIDDLVPLLETEGFGGTNPEKFYRQFVTLNKILKFEEDKEIPDQFEYSLLSSTVNWEYWYAQQSYTKKLLQSEVAETGDRTKYDEFMLNNDLYKKKYFNKQFSNEYYELDKIYENSPYGSKAREALSNLYTELNVINQDELNDIDELEKSKNKEVVLRKIRQLSSLKYENGTLKQGVDLGIAKVIREYREASKPFISYVERDNAFQKALSRYEESLLIKYTADSSEYINLREAFILANTSVSYTEEYFDELSKIGKELDEVLSTIPSFKNKDAIKAAMNEISDALIGFKDEENQPVATDMSEDRIERVKKANILIETLRNEFGSLLGLTASDFARYNELFEIIKNKTQLTSSEQDEFDILDSKKSSLTKVQKARLKRVYAKFAEIRTKEPTDYYLDIFNNFLQKVNTDSLNDEIDSRIINNLTADLVSDDLIISKLINQNDEFKEWFLKNHYMKSFYSKEEERQVDKWIRVSVWSVNKPADDIFYNKTQLKDLNGNNVGEPINRVPSFKYKERVVNEIVEIKDEYDNIDKIINNITPKIVGETVDNRDRWLPLNIEQGAPRDSPFINNEYYALKGNSPEKFKILEILTKFHLLNQEDLDYKSKLYLTVPKFGKDLSEKVQSGKTYETPISKLQGYLNTVKEVFVSTKDDFDRGLNYKKENEYQLMAADMFDSENTGIVIQGLSDIDYKAVSLDLSQSLIKYGNSAEKQKKLTEIWPITSALSKIVNNPKSRYDANNIVKQSYLNNNTVTPPNKKNKNNRAKAIDNFVDHQFKGVNLVGIFADNAFAIKSTSLLMKAASFGFFGLDVQSAIVNTSGMYIQSAILASGDRHLNELTLADGTVWAHATVMKQLTMGVYNKAQDKPIELQLFEIFDISEGRLAIKMSEPLSRTLGRDLMNLSFFYSPRKFGELANMSSMLGGFMKHKLIKQTINGVEKEIAYRDAWVLKDGKLTLAEGIDKEYDINGKKFISFRNLMQEKARTLGSVSSLDTPQMSRYWIGKIIGFLRSFLTPIIISRVGFMTKNKKWYIPEERYNLATGEAEMGAYVRTLKELAAVFKYGGQNLRHMNKETKQAFFRTFFEIGVVMLLTYANQLLFGWDPEDPDRYKKMKKRSGSLPLPWIDNDKGGEFKLKGWLANQAVYLLLKIRTENEAFLPLPGFGLDDYSRLINIDAAAVFGSTIVNYTKIVNNLVQAAGDKKSAYYTRTVGPYDFQQKGSLKALNFLAKSFGFSGKFVDPTMATKSLIDVLNKLGGGSSGGSNSNTKDDNESNTGTYLMR